MPVVVFAVGVLVSAAGVSASQSLALARLYQGRNRGPEQSDTFSRKIRIARDGRVSISNVSGDIEVVATSGDEVSIDATKRWRGGRDAGDRVRIVVDERPSRIEVRTEYGSVSRGDDVEVDYKVAIPSSVALDVHSVSGRVHVTGVKGALRLGSVSGNITTAETPGLEYARTVSGALDLAGISHDNPLSVSTVSGNVRINGVKAREFDVNTVSGDVTLRDASCGRVTAKSMSGSFDYAGALERNGRYEVNSHSGEVRFTVAATPGFELSAASFSGSVRSDFQMTVGGPNNPNVRRLGPRRESLQATYGDGSASLQLRTFSGNITVAKR